MTIFLDAFALVALLRAEPGGAEVRDLLRRGDCAMPTINVAETFDVLRRVHGVAPDRLDAALSGLLGDSVAVVDIGLRIAIDAVALRSRHCDRTRSPLSLADCVALAATAQRPGASLATAEGAER